MNANSWHDLWTATIIHFFIVGHLLNISTKVLGLQLKVAVHHLHFHHLIKACLIYRAMGSCILTPIFLSMLSVVRAIICKYFNAIIFCLHLRDLAHRLNLLLQLPYQSLLLFNCIIFLIK